jgi:uncharacterized membrane protein
MTRETIKRSVLKTISWHVLHFVMAGLIAFLITHRIDFAALIASAELIWESIIFFLHERLWAGIRFGRRGERRHGHGRH